MKQVIQNFKSGNLYVDDVPMPSLSEGMVLVENEYSLISAGTERSTVKVAQANLLGKAKQRPDLVAQVIQNVKKEGLAATINKVKTKLDSLKAMGYSTAGTVLTSLDTKGVFKPGDRVACAGLDYATHSEIISVPQNLIAKVPDNVSLDEAAFTTLGAIALQGIRQADPKLGEKVCVIGLGLLGQLTVQMLRANGCTVMGIDMSEDLIKLAENSGANKASHRNDPNLISVCENLTNGNGFDAIIITAATSSNDPVVLATEIARKKGKIVIVGAVKMDIPREPYFYKNELELKISCSYGPGRYDINYEELGMDYPYAYVRWTEQRNMEAFLDLLSQKVIDVKPLITHVFDIAEAEHAYDIVMGKRKERHIGILLKYGENEHKHASKTVVNNGKPGHVNVGFIGAGSFAQSYLVPNVKAWGASLDGVVTSRGITSKNVLDKFTFNFCSTDIKDILSKSDIDTVFIATPHVSHAELVIESLKAKKNVFVEKPLAMNLDQLRDVVKAQSEYSTPIMVGFNRRFAPVSEEIKNEIKSTGEPVVVNIRVNAGFIPKDHWSQLAEVGGGRIIGEICHFIDLMQFFTDGNPIKVYAESISSDNERIMPDDNVAVVVKFDDGSIGNLTYVANGDKSLPKEYIEVYSGGKVGIINDFRNGFLHKEGKVIKLKSSGKGHKEEVHQFLENIKEGKNSPIEFESLCLTTLTTFKILDSLSTGLPQTIGLEDLQ
jgi:polar amino acid transport system substrate-binding protein